MGPRYRARLNLRYLPTSKSVSQNEVMENRTLLRVKQDYLLHMAEMFYPSMPERERDNLRFTAHVGAPRLCDLREFVYPEWESALDTQLEHLAAELKMGLPDWDNVVRLCEL